MCCLFTRLFGSRDQDPRPVFPAGIKELHAGENPVVDICFVHGLTGDRELTWTAEGETRPWPEVLLAPKLPDARIFTFGYDAYIVRKGVASRNGLNDHAINFLHDLAGVRHDCETRPLVFVAHSLGGIVCKKTLLVSRESPEPRFKSIADATVGVAFLGTPHLGASKASWAKVPISALGPFKSKNTKLIDVLCTDDVFLEDVRDRFVRVFLHPDAANGPIQVACFLEELPVFGVGVIVDRTSATLDGNLPFSIHANHMEMAKFKTAAEPGFRQLLGDLRRWTQTARPQTFEEATSMSHEDVSRYTKECQMSLKFSEMEARAGDIDHATQGTCQWLLQYPKYLEWSTNGRGLFWIKGNPGSGKSTLLKHIYLHHQKTGDELLLSFFFHDRGDELQKTPLGFYRSLAYQLLCTLRTSVVDLINVYQTHHALQPTAPIQIHNWVWTEKDLQQYILRTIPKILDRRAVRLFVDALDEAGEKNAVGVFRWLRDLVADTTDCLFPFRLCVSCRHYPVVTVRDFAFEVYVEKENDKDIDTYVRQQLQNELDRTDALMAEISSLIVSRAKGIFLWVRFVVEDVIAALRDGKNPSAVRNVVNNTPGEVTALYKRQVLAMQGDRESLELLQWVCFAVRPLTLGEIRWTLAIPLDCQHTSLEDCSHASDVRDLKAIVRHVRAASRGLVEITASESTDPKPVAQFIHQTTKEYVLGTGLATLQGGGLSSAEIARRAHVHLAKICIQYVAKKEVGIFARLSTDKWPFFRYTLEQWQTHLRLADCNCYRSGNGDCTHVDDCRAILRLLRWPSNDIILRSGSSGYGPYSSTSTLLHQLAKTGSMSLLHVAFQQTPQIDVNPLDDNGNTPLMEAFDEAVAGLLLDHGAKIDHANDNGWTVLQFAVQKSNVGVVQLLLQKGADPNCKDTEGRTALSVAVSRGNKAIEKLLQEAAAAVRG